MYYTNNHFIIIPTVDRIPDLDGTPNVDHRHSTWWSTDGVQSILASRLIV